MKPILIMMIITTLVLPPMFFVNVDALLQVGGSTNIDIQPAQSDVFAWGLSNEHDKTIQVQLSAVGEGSEFLTFDEILTLSPKQLVYSRITVNIPDDYPGGIELRPTMIATEMNDQEGGSAIKLKMARYVHLNIAPNNDSSLWVDWDTLKKSQESQASANIALKQSAATSIPQPTGQGQPIPTNEITGQNQESTGFTLVANPQSAADSSLDMDPEPTGFDLEDVTLQAPTDNGGGCLIATATYGSELASQVQLLREIRDDKLLSTSSGSSFMTGFNSFYYSFSPTIADLERQNPAFKELVKITITPLLTSLSILNYVDVDSEAEMLGWGLSLIVLNVGMYIADSSIQIQ